MNYKCQTNSDINKVFNYAKRLLENSRFGILIRVDKKRLNRSINQNNYLWGVVYKTISDATGYTVQEIHQLMKQQFLIVKKIKGKDKTFIITKSTTELKTDEMEEYLENIRNLAAEWINIIIPLPNEIIKEKK